MSINEEQTKIVLKEPVIGILHDEQEINVLRAAYDHFSNYDRVVGSHAAEWARALDAIGLVINSLITKSEVKKAD